MLKGIKEIDTYLTEWLTAHDFDAIATLGTDFMCDLESNTINYALVISEEHDKLFLGVCKECREEIVACPNFILSFFHELGHIETEDMWDDDEWDYYFENVAEGLDPLTYYHSPIEYEATKWGCDYICDHTNIIQQLIEGLSPLVNNFYKLNEVK